MFNSILWLLAWVTQTQVHAGVRLTGDCAREVTFGPLARLQ